MSNTEETGLQHALDDLMNAAMKMNEVARQLAQRRQNAPLAAAAPLPGQGGALIQLTPDQRVICERVINAFETGSIQGDYSNITIFHDGPGDVRQITYGRAQTTEYGNLRELVAMYAAAGGTFSNELRGYVDRIPSDGLVDDARFKELLHRAGAEDPVMRRTQDTFFDRRYFQPALSWAQTNGFSRALSVLVIYDSYIHSGKIRDELRARFPENVPARGGNEQIWIQQYVAVRNDWLQNNPRPVVRASAYRTRDLAREIARGNWDLTMLPISANGVQVDARPIAAAMAAAAAPDAGMPHLLGAAYGRAGGAWIEADAIAPGLAVDDSDPAAPRAGEVDDWSGGSQRANFGDTSALDLSPVGAVAGAAPLLAAAAPQLTLDMNKVRAFLQACETSQPRVTYGLGKKVPFLAAVPGRDFTQVDCSGFVREALRLATTPPIAFPDGSVNQHDWIRAQGFAKSTVSAATQNDGLVRIAFLRPQDTKSHIGHVVLIAGGRTLESHGGVGPDSRAWTGMKWQASTFVYVLARDTGIAAHGVAMLAGAGPASFTVRNGHRYRATLSLGGFEQFAGNDLIAGKLRGYGFANVSVTGSGTTRYAEGTWTGPDTTGQLDSHIVSVAEIPLPAVAALV